MAHHEDPKTRAGTPAPPTSPQPTPDGAGALRVAPDALMTETTRPRMGRMLAISSIFHVALIGLTSITYLGLCLKHHSLHPKWVIKQILKEEVEKQAAAEATKAAEEAVKKAFAAKKGTPGKESAEPAPGKGTEPSSATPAGKASGKEPSDKKSGVEKAVSETSKDRPKGSSLKLDELDAP